MNIPIATDLEITITLFFTNKIPDSTKFGLVALKAKSRKSKNTVYLDIDTSSNAEIGIDSTGNNAILHVSPVLLRKDPVSHIDRISNKDIDDMDTITYLSMMSYCQTGNDIPRPVNIAAKSVTIKSIEMHIIGRPDRKVFSNLDDSVNLEITTVVQEIPLISVHEKVREILRIKKHPTEAMYYIAGSGGRRWHLPKTLLDEDVLTYRSICEHHRMVGKKGDDDLDVDITLRRGKAICNICNSEFPADIPAVSEVTDMCERFKALVNIAKIGAAHAGMKRDIRNQLCELHALVDTFADAYKIIMSFANNTDCGDETTESHNE